MLKTLNALLAIQTSSAVNLFIYYVQKLPLIGKRIPDSLYANKDLKTAISIMMRIFMLLWGFATRAAYIGLLLYLPVVALGEGLPKEDQLRQFTHILLLLSFVVACVSSTTALEPKRAKYAAVKLMRMAPDRYMHATFCYKYGMFFIYWIPSMLLFGSLLGASIMQLLLLTLSVTMWRVLCEYLHLKLFDKTGTVLIKQNIIVWLVIGLGYAAAYIPLFLKQVPLTGSLPLSLPAIVITIAAGLFGAVKLARYSDYRAAVDAATKRDDPLLDLGRMMTEANKTSVQSKDSDYSSTQQLASNIDSKEGYAYLNAIFFARHRSLISKPVNARLAIIGGLGIAGSALMLTVEQVATFLATNLGIIIPFLVLTMIYFTVGERTCKAMFYNCDLSLLRYSFYRRAAFRHFQIRLYKIAGQNLIIAAALGAALTLIYLTAGGDLADRDMLMLWISVLVLSLFFSIHHLFLYYIFQPYATELNVKNPLFYLVNLVVSGLAGVCLVVRVPSVLFTTIVFTVTAIYLLAALILVRKYGSRTFRVK